MEVTPDTREETVEAPKVQPVVEEPVVAEPAPRRSWIRRVALAIVALLLAPYVLILIYALPSCIRSRR